MKRPELVDFILKDVNSNMLKEYINNMESIISRIKEIVNNDKIAGIEAKLIIKDMLESDD